MNAMLQAKNKNDLMQFVYARLVEPFFQGMEEISASELAAAQKLSNILRHACDHAIKHKGLIGLLAREDQVGQIRKDTHPRLLRILTTISSGHREGSFRRITLLIRPYVLGLAAELFELQKGWRVQRRDERVRDDIDRDNSNGFSLQGKEVRSPAKKVAVPWIGEIARASAMFVALAEGWSVDRCQEQYLSFVSWWYVESGPIWQFTYQLVSIADRHEVLLVEDRKHLTAGDRE